MPPRASYANVVSTLALVAALGGGGAAVAAGLANNSVGSAQIKDGQVKTSDLGKDSVNGLKVKHDSLSGDDVLESSLKLTNTLVKASAINVSPGVLSDTRTDYASVTLKAPAAGAVVVTVQAEFRAATDGTYIGAYIKADGVISAYSDWDAGDVDGYYDQHQSFFAVLPVTKGTHTYVLQLDESFAADQSSVYGAQIVAQYTKGGVAPVAPPSRSVGRRGANR